MASIAPTLQAAIARGNRSLQINSPCLLDVSWIAASHSDPFRETDPVALAKKILPIDSNSNKKSNDRRNEVGIILQD